MRNIKYILALVTIGILVGQMPLKARAIRVWSYDELVTASDAVMILETIGNENNTDTFKMDGSNISSFQGVSTTFRVLYCWKGSAPSSNAVVKHFVYKPNIGWADGAMFVHFRTEPLIFEGKLHRNRDSKDPGEAIRTEQSVPHWLAFLKMAPDGSYVPVTGQYDASLSFKELHD